MNSQYQKKLLEAKVSALEKVRHFTQNYAGPTLIEVLVRLFSPIDKPEAIKLNKSQQKLMTDYYREDRLLARNTISLKRLHLRLYLIPSTR